MKKTKPKKSKPKRARKQPRAVFVHVIGTTHDPYDNAIGGPNDYAYGM